MTNDVIKFNTIVEDIGRSISELAQIGQDSFKVPLVTTPDELAEMVGLPMGSFRPLSHNLIWFFALKTTVYAQQMLEEAARIFDQLEDEESARKVQGLIEAFDEQFHPCETAFQVYSRLLDRPSTNGSCKE
jgi:hypothetical protein